MSITLIGLDADDTLWHNETIFRMTHDRFNDLLADYAAPEEVEAHLAAVERRNIGAYGYGAKSFTLCMLETALEVSGKAVPAEIIAAILDAGREMMHHAVEPLPGVEDALEALAGRARLILITKGDLFHQEQKLAASGLGGFFSGVEIVSEKKADTYARIFARHGGAAETSLMAGNSMRSDILPALEAGSWATLIPYPLVWEHEAADAPDGHPRYAELETLGQLAGWVDGIKGR